LDYLEDYGNVKIWRVLVAQLLLLNTFVPFTNFSRDLLSRSAVLEVACLAGRS
jgi:hypothetical protein